jgi:hypothetical protein
MNEVIQPLRFYATTTERLHYRNLDLNYKVITPLVMPSTSFIPFILYETLDLTFLAVKECKIYNYKTGASMDVIANMNFIFGIDSDSTFMFHPGNSTISAMQQGVYYLVVKSGYDNYFYSDLFCVGNYNTVLFEFHNTKSFGKLWMRDEYYRAYYRGWTFDQGEWDEYSESYKDDNNFDYYSYQRKDKLRTVLLMGDSNTIDCLKYMSMCDSVYLTDEVSNRSAISITDVTVEHKGANYMNVIVKYRITDHSIISVNTNTINKVFEQTGVAFEAPESGIYLGPDKVVLGKKKITW